MEDGQILLRFHEGTKVCVSKGLAKAILPEETNKPYYAWTSGSRNYDASFEERIRLPANNGLLVTHGDDGKIKFDDRKLRFSHLLLDNDLANIYVAPTHYGETWVDNKATHDKTFFDGVKDLGIRNFSDQWAYFASCFAVNSFVVTSDGYIPVFQRGAKTQAYPGYWHVVGGFLDYSENLFDSSDPTKELFGVVTKRMLTELEEECGIFQGEIQIELTGLVRNMPGTVDFSHCAKIAIPKTDFLRRISAAFDRDEHSQIRMLNGASEVDQFLRDEQKIVPSGRGSLELFLSQV